jgi:glutaredoxin
MNKQNIFYIILAVVIIVGFSLIFVLKKSKTNGQIVLFYGDGCPHCENVDAFVAENGIETKVPFVKKEVFNNQTNAAEMADFAKQCGLATDSIGVPFLWDGRNCFTGDIDIINFFKGKTGLR